MQQQTTNKVRSYLVSQFGRPRGALGHLAGFIMASRTSNQQRNAWTVELLDPKPDSRVLEIGCGPGLALRHLAERCPQGLVVGLDRSKAMLAQAARRNRDAVRAGRVQLRQGDIELSDAVADPASFDRILAVNVAMFFSERARTLKRLRALLREGGRIAITQQPRWRGATDEDAIAAGSAWADALSATGFSNVRVELLRIAPVAATCTLGEA